jgi:hypothetical protein
MASTELSVQVSFDLLDKSPELQGLLRKLIREELMHLDPAVANSMLDQLATRLGRLSVRSQGAWRSYEVKANEQQL